MLAANLENWFAKVKRPMSWRRRPSPYACWLSEIMMQQTTYAAVLPYYERFLKKFPTVEKLAAAKESEVLKAWEGLGYYARARNLLKAAHTVAASATKAKKKGLPVRKVTAVIVRNQQNKDCGLLKGLWELPTVETVEDVTQVFSHFKLEQKNFKARRLDAEFRDPKKVPLTTATRKALAASF